MNNEKNVYIDLFEFRVSRLAHTIKQWFKMIPTSEELKALLKALGCEDIQAFVELNKQSQQQRVKNAIELQIPSNQESDDVESLLKAYCPTTNQGDIFNPLNFYKCHYVNLENILSQHSDNGRHYARQFVTISHYDGNEKKVIHKEELSDAWEYSNKILERVAQETKSRDLEYFLKMPADRLSPFVVYTDANLQIGDEIDSYNKLEILEKCGLILLMKNQGVMDELNNGSFKFRVGKLTDTMNQWFKESPSSNKFNDLLKALGCQNFQAFSKLDKEVQQQRVKDAIESMKTSLNEESTRENGDDDVENLVKAYCLPVNQADLFNPLAFYKSLNNNDKPNKHPTHGQIFTSPVGPLDDVVMR